MCISVSRRQIIAAAATLAVALIIITPLCGLIFRCGCTWPGLGLDSGCNFYDSEALHKCPWCASLIMGWFSVLLALFSGLTATIKLVNGQTGIRGISMGIMIGLTIFFCVAVISGWFAAWLRGYPLF